MQGLFLTPSAVVHDDYRMTLVFTEDGRYLFLNSARAGNDDNFWVDAGFLAELR